MLEPESTCSYVTCISLLSGQKKAAQIETYISFRRSIGQAAGVPSLVLERACASCACGSTLKAHARDSELKLCWPLYVDLAASCATLKA